jgi:hypothetical protein
MAAAALFCRIVLIAECAALALAISSYCMPPASAATSFYGLCRDISAADPLSQCAPGLELLGFGVDVSMCKSYGCRPSVDFDKDFVNKEVNMCCSPACTATVCLHACTGSLQLPACMPALQLPA